MGTRRIIVNADDFGMNAETNRAIVEAFERGVISSTTLMANMPGFEEACELARRHQLCGRIGVHLNLTEGRPISGPIKRVSLFCDANGEFRPRRTLFHLSSEEAQAVDAEFSAQIDACIERGIRPTHLDSHQHVHTEWAIGAVAIIVARRYGIGAIRLSRNCGPGIGMLSRVYKLAYNSRLKLHGLAKTRYFGSARDVIPLLASTQDDVEIMVHLTSASTSSVLDNGAGAGGNAQMLREQLTSYAC